MSDPAPRTLVATTEAAAAGAGAEERGRLLNEAVQKAEEEAPGWRGEQKVGEEVVEADCMSSLHRLVTARSSEGKAAVAGGPATIILVRDLEPAWPQKQAV